MSGSFSSIYNTGNGTVSIQNGKCVLSGAPDGEILLFQKPLSTFQINLRTLEHNAIAGDGQIRNFPVKSLNALWKKNLYFMLDGGLVNGSIQFTGVDGHSRDIELDSQLEIQGLALDICGHVYQMEDCAMSGKSAFTDFFRFYEIRHLKTVLLEENVPYAEIYTDAKLYLKYDFSAEFHFSVDHATENLLRIMVPLIPEYCRIRDLVIAGKAVLFCSKDYLDGAFHSDWDIRQGQILTTPETVSPEKWTAFQGGVSLDFQYEDGGSFEIRDSSLMLEEKNSGRRLVHLSLDHVNPYRPFPDENGRDGAGQNRKSEEGSLVSDGLDLQFLKDVLTSRERIETAETVPSETNLWKKEIVSLKNSFTLSNILYPSLWNVQQNVLMKENAFNRDDSEGKIPFFPSGRNSEGTLAAVSGQFQKTTREIPFAFGLEKTTGPDSCKKIHIALENLHWGDSLRFSLNGSADFSGNRLVSIDGLSGRINDQDSFSFNMRLFCDSSEIWPFSFQLKADQFDIQPFIQTFLQASEAWKKQYQGKLRNVSFTGSGKGFSRKALEEHLQSGISFDVENLVMPFMRDETILLFRIIFFPLDVIPRLADQLPDGSVKGLLQQVLASNLDLITGRRKLEFSKGHVVLEETDGKCWIREFLLEGPMIELGITEGWINFFTRRMDVKSETVLSGVVFPLHYYGPLNEPDWSIPEFIPSFMIRNSWNLFSGTLSILTLGYGDEYLKIPDFL